MTGSGGGTIKLAAGTQYQNKQLANPGVSLGSRIVVKVMLDLETVVHDLATGLKAADALGLRARSQRGSRLYRAGIGPHSEDAAMGAAVAQMKIKDPMTYRDVRPVPYPQSRRRCDLGIGKPTAWAIEVKMARAFGDNGKLDDTYLKDLLSPYERDHSALSDATKLLEFDCRRGPDLWFRVPESTPRTGNEALELLMAAVVKISTRIEVSFKELMHPIHSNGRVIAWEVLSAVPPEDRSSQPP